MDWVMAVPAKNLVKETMASLEIDRLELPQALRSNIAKHQAHLESLAVALLVGGQSEDGVRQTLDNVFASYKTELTKTIIAIRKLK